MDHTRGIDATSARRLFAGGDVRAIFKYQAVDGDGPIDGWIYGYRNNQTLILAECCDVTLKIAAQSRNQDVLCARRCVFFLGHNLPGHPHEPGIVSTVRAGGNALHFIRLHSACGRPGAGCATASGKGDMAGSLERHFDLEHRQRLSHFCGTADSERLGWPDHYTLSVLAGRD